MCGQNKQAVVAATTAVTRKFNVGDKVRTTREIAGYHLPIGTEGSVEEVFSEPFIFPYTVEFTSTQGTHDFFMAEVELEAVETHVANELGALGETLEGIKELATGPVEPIIGQRVVLLERYGSLKVGDLATVKSFVKAADYGSDHVHGENFLVKLVPDNGEGVHSMYEKRFAPVPEVASVVPSDEPQIGSQVEILVSSGAFDAQVLKGGQIVGINYDLAHNDTRAAYIVDLGHEHYAKVYREQIRLAA